MTTTTTTTTMMKALKLEKDQPPKIVEIPKPPMPNKNEIMVKIVCAAIDTATDSVTKKDMFSGLLHSSKGPIGWHYSGTVEHVGENDDEAAVVAVVLFKKGDAVFGFLPYDANTTQGSYSEYVTVPTSQCAKKPRNVSFQVAAAATTESITALQAMRDKGGLEDGKSVLVVGAGGGVGSAAVMIAKAMGARVTAVCSTKDAKRIEQEYKADVVIDRTKEPDYVEHSLPEKAYDVVFDTPATLNFGVVSKALKDVGGTYVTTLPSLTLAWDQMTSSLCSKKKAAMVFAECKSEDLQLVADWLSKGKLKIEIASRHKISNMADALKSQADRKKVGRVVLDVQGGW